MSADDDRFRGGVRRQAPGEPFSNAATMALVPTAKRREIRIELMDLPLELLVSIFEMVLRDNPGFNPFAHGLQQTAGSIGNWYRLAHVNKYVRGLLGNVRANLTIERVPGRFSDAGQSISRAVELFSRANISALFGKEDLPTAVGTQIKRMLKQENMVAPMDDLGRTPLMIACAFGSPRVVRVLVERAEGLDAGAVGALRDQPLAVAHRDAFVLPKLMKAVDNVGNTVLINAMTWHGCQIKFLIAHYLFEVAGELIEVNETNHVGESALYVACQTLLGPPDDLSSIQLLLDHGADARLTTGAGNTMVHALASASTGPYSARFSVRREIDRMGVADLINKRNSAGQTPFFLACAVGNFRIADELIGLGADVTLRSNEGITPLELTCGAEEHPDSRYALVTRILGSGADATVGIPLHKVCSQMRYGHVRDQPLVNLLIDNNANVDATDEHGATALHLAAFNARANLIGTLVGRGATVDARDNDGRTPFMIAALRGDKKIMTILRDAGANPSATDFEGRTVGDLLELRGYDEGDEYF
jgi:ankyrin repeat protein